jgi:short subunit dehydrogenase-like uncharacterized protein
MGTKWMIYGAYGYTGELIAREAVHRGLEPVLAGRNAKKLESLAGELGLEMRAFPADPAAAPQLDDIDVLLHCAGPFSETSGPMIEACLVSRTHYTDITGEIPVFEHTHAQHARAVDAGIVICCGVGFDVIPTDCAALKLKQLLPDAAHLALGFDSDSGISPGTFKTMIQGLGSGSAVRRYGKLIPVPLGSQQRTIDFGRGSRSAMGIPWGDVATAFYTTGIPNISTWIPMAKPVAAAARASSISRPLLSAPAVQKALRKWVEQNISGPDQELRTNSPAFIWGEAVNAAGVRKTVRIQTANVYDLTVYGALEVCRRLLEEENAPGSWTPASLFGAELVEGLPGSGKFETETFYP